ncbi:Protein MPS-1 [Aphelenchoides bicaudatus]|nr:Protein MPS-1 [Aphelenchoides bicaudatus]
MKAPAFQYARWPLPNNASMPNASSQNATANLNAGFCQCLDQLQQYCFQLQEPVPLSNLNYNSDVGRMMYSIAILFMFSMVILLLMVRSIKRSNSTIEVEALLHSMQYREELDLAQRQKRRLQKAKNKVTAWLTKTNGKMWNSSPQIILPSSPAYNGYNIQKLRNDSVQSSGSYIPEIIISNSDDIRHCRQNSYTPSLSLIYDFGVHSRKNSSYSEMSDTIDLSQMSDISHDLDLNALSPQPPM